MVESTHPDVVDAEESSMNSRSKGLRIERLAVAYAKSLGFDVISIYQPRGQHQVCDMILLSGQYRRIRFVEVRYGSYRLERSKDLQTLNALHCQQPLSATCEIWKFGQGATEPVQRVLE